jgi:AcrR family transcriptional regulator
VARAERRGPDDWAAAALEALREGGLAGVSVEGVARRLGITKGSFYWHFADRAALLRAALSLWEKRETEDVIALLAGLRGPRERLLRLFEVVGRRPVRPMHLAVSAAAHDPAVRAVLRRVSRRRLRYLEDCYRGLGLEAAEARRRAVLAYSAYVGFLHLAAEGGDTPDTPAALEAYRRHVVDALVPLPAPARRPRK